MKGLNNNRKVIDCSTRGDRRFSPIYAKVSAFGKVDTIENHYQLSRRFILHDGTEVAPRTAKEARMMGKKEIRGGLGLTWADTFVLPNGVRVPSKYLRFGWYSALWLKYLDSQPELVEYAKQFDAFEDPYGYKGTLNATKCIELYVKHGRAALKARCLDFFLWLKDPVAKEEYDLMHYNQPSYEIYDW